MGVAVPTTQVAIEIAESEAGSGKLMREFGQQNRNAGFIITLDDFGSDHSNFGRVAMVRPEIIKIDKTIVSGVVGDEYRRLVLQSVTNLARIVGALALAASGHTRFLSERYVSLASGRVVRTPVLRVDTTPGQSAILCLGLYE